MQNREEHPFMCFIADTVKFYQRTVLSISFTTVLSFNPSVGVIINSMQTYL
jgi:hypothetical protein